MTHEFEVPDALASYGRLSLGVVYAAAIADGKDPIEMPSLYGVIDPDALDALLANRGRGRVEFEYGNFHVAVHGDGRIVLVERGVRCEE
jgi:hypothetical protein